MRYDLIKLAIIITLIIGIWFYVTKDPTESNIGLFSWDKETVIENGEPTSDFLEQYHITRLFQSFSSDLSFEEIQLFCEAIGEDIAVYQLIGTPEWAHAESRERLLEEAERVVDLNQRLPANQQLKGLVVDIEPYGLDDFDWDDETLQMSFMANMKALYKYVTANDLEMITVVPYFYDTKGYKEVLEFLITEASTELAIMNYYRDDEIEHMMYEADIAQSAGIPVTTIYEFKPPGEYGLTERNTYYGEGLERALSNLETIKATYENQAVYGAFHDLTALKEVVGYE
ncbi:hypothetical protein SAMN05421839_10464 [Halolactibacillus halophilus]|uniref:Uncharacterized protein n=1 Tax=Halolactibacillus halophilus TaxID=306540 RepID=A0A1I5M7A8_9BACI|nr:hypothetical protein [Halolactibacillus halophilus]GEM01046.1 hypothetical protein HHA03_05780 [Halolactibacillus halophilus]SFP05464.1 hypothetical protein SAMN05421839_10464 [Halolactibacillus halophilus]